MEATERNIVAVLTREHGMGNNRAQKALAEWREIVRYARKIDVSAEDTAEEIARLDRKWRKR